ncbi:MAG: AAA family ATPase [Canibacter sp.]
MNEQLSTERAQWSAAAIRETADAIERVIYGKRRVVELVLAAMIADGHVLLEDVPGTGKTALARTLAKVTDGESSRIQFTPDLLPGDVTGLNVYNQAKSTFDFHAGPIFANVVLADEINRASPKTQSALLEVMEERQVTVDGTTYDVGAPFLVIATQNSVEQAGTYRLPEAQLDRFMMKTSLGYPDEAATLQILQGTFTTPDLPIALGQGTMAQLQEFATRVYLSHVVADYISRLLDGSRRAQEVRLGVSVRGGIALVRLAKAWALVQGRTYVTPDDVRDLTRSVFAHRLVLEPEAEFEGVTAEQVIDQLLLDIPAPQESE